MMEISYLMFEKKIIYSLWVKVTGKQKLKKKKTLAIFVILMLDLS
jgi:hypothetical protein